MGNKGRTDQTPTPSRSDAVSAYDESFSVSEDGRPIPIVRGEQKVAVRWVISPFYGQREWVEPQKKRGK